MGPIYNQIKLKISPEILEISFNLVSVYIYIVPLVSHSALYLSRNDEQDGGDEDGEADKGEAGARRHPGEEKDSGQGQGPDQDDQEEAKAEAKHPGALLVLLHDELTVTGMWSVRVVDTR